MVWRKTFLAALLASAIGGPVAAETLAVVRQAADSGVLIDLDTIRLTGTTGRVRTLAFARSPDSGPPRFADVEQEYDCTQMRVRTRQVRLLDQRGGVAAQINGEFGAWIVIAGDNPNAITWGAVCRGQFVSSMQRVASVAAFSARYPAGPVAAAPAPAPARPAAQAPAPARAPAAGASWVYNDGASKTASVRLFDLNSRRRTGSVVSITGLRILLKPFTQSNDLLRWTEETNEFDCVAHRARTRTDGFRSLDLSDRLPRNGEPFGEWSASDPGSLARENEDLFCRDQANAAHKNVSDLRAFQHSYYASMGEKEPTTPEQAFASARSLLRWHAYTDPTFDIAAMWDNTTERRQGDIVSFTELVLSRRPGQGNTAGFVWMESASQMDCANHRVRQKYEAMLDRGRKTRAPVTNAVYEAWTPTGQSRYVARLEAYLCNKTPSDTFRLVTDVDAFATSFLAGPNK